jgi:hypothetical protein
MQEVQETGKNDWKAIAKKVKKSIVECMEMAQMLISYKKLGKTTSIKEGGIKITICPPAFCRGVSPDRNVKSRS